MNQVPCYTSISLALSEVMEEIGVNESIVKTRRRTMLLIETLRTMFHRLMGQNVSVYLFGSQSEGTTTLGLRSDSDDLICLNTFNIITDRSKWEHGVSNFLIVQDENTAPGYCMLQILQRNAPLPLTNLHHQAHFRDQQGRILLKKSFILSKRPGGKEQHGPSFASQGQDGYTDTDTVCAFPCKSLLPEVRHWLSQQTPGRWPTEDMKRYIANSAWFVVAVGCRGSVNEDLEWRLSTSLYERCLMFGLNITQIQVYVLMKMILPNINLNVPAESHISSFMCKTVLLHCIQITNHNAWQRHNLIQCLMFCLSLLNICVMTESCPHFIIRSNNLMVRRFTAEAKHELLQNFRYLFNYLIGHGLFSVRIHDAGKKLIGKLTGGIFGMHIQNCTYYTLTMIHYLCVTNCAIGKINYLRIYSRHLVTKNPNSIAQVTAIVTNMVHLQKLHMHGNAIEKLACKLVIPIFCTTVGSLLASTCIQNGQVVSQDAEDYFSLGLNSDVASSRLKLASVFFCAGVIERAETVLRDVENRYDFRLCETICACCACCAFRKQKLDSRVSDSNSFAIEQYIQLRTANCVIFLPNEINCAPPELQYEMFRSTPHDLPHRGEDDQWMDWAVVDSPPYLYYLQYKTYQRLARYNDQQRALDNLMLAISMEQNLGHKETALNLLGQCLEQENRHNHALQCYIRSLNIRHRNNAARWHVCLLLYRAFTRG